jgi:diadenosine tetraphosphate (Ap4A) HIT family hydrolase
MPESAEEWYARVRDGLETDGYREVPWPGWATWPFEGELHQRPLEAPAEERPRGGTGGNDCVMCGPALQDGLVWHDDVAMLGVPAEGTSLPLAAFLMPRRHADLADLTEAEAGRMGQLLTHVERAARDVLDVPRIQVVRWGDGQEHLHWWLMARPTGSHQLRGSFLSLWDDVLPLRPADDLRADLELVAARVVELAGGEVVSRSR